MKDALEFLKMRYTVEFRRIEEYQNKIALVGVYKALETPFAPLVLLIIHEDGMHYIEEYNQFMKDIVCTEARVIAKCMEAKDINGDYYFGKEQRNVQNT